LDTEKGIMRLKSRFTIAAAISPLLLFGVLVEPAQAVTGALMCTGYDGLNSGHVFLSDIINPVVSYQIQGLHGTRATVEIVDFGSHSYATSYAIQDGIYHAIQGPYHRFTNTRFSATFHFSNGDWCSVAKPI
jgi:hypothetical protein